MLASLMLVAARAGRIADAAPQHAQGSSSRRSARLAAAAPSNRLLLSLSVLPIEMWHQVLRLLPPHEIGGR